jgi:putative tricarboxylic transport membrane protein
MSRVALERLVALAIVAVALAYFALAFQIRVPPSSDGSPFSARSFPFAIGLATAALALWIAVRPPPGAEIEARAFAWGRAAGLVALMAGFALLIAPLGFVVTASLFLAGGFFVLGERRPRVLLPVAVVTALAFWIAFTLLDVRLDWGVFGRLFG